MAGDNDKGTGFNGEVDGLGNGDSVGVAVGGIQQLHGKEIVFAQFHVEGDPFFQGMFLCKSGKTFAEIYGQFVVFAVELSSMVSISGHTAKTEQKHGFQSADIFVICPDGGDIIRSVGVCFAAASARGKDYAFIYTPHGREIKVDGSLINTQFLRASWYNPRTGEEKLICYLKPRKAVFVPETRGKGQDWVLILDGGKRDWVEVGQLKAEDR